MGFFVDVMIINDINDKVRKFQLDGKRKTLWFIFE